MALPKSSETDRTIYLRNIVETSGTEAILSWPRATDDDLVLFARIITIYSGIDFALRYVAEIMDRARAIAESW